MNKELVIATHNIGKAKEISEILSPYFSSFVTSAELGLTEPEETGASFEENALIKARSAAAETGKMALADDSGLSVRALQGEPGIYSARWAGDARDFNMAMERVNEALGMNSDRHASFVCSLALVVPGSDTNYCFEGRADGAIIWPPRGELGFGYDPIFVPEGYEQTFAELSPKEKNTISHRAKAIQELVNFLSDKDLETL
jgi:XTP/dITP diphosphohydrolase